MDAPPELHPTEDVLDAFGLGKLDEQAFEAVSQHLESCPSCQRRVTQLPPDTFLDYLRSARTLTGSATLTGSPLAGAPFDYTDQMPPSPWPMGLLPTGLGYQVLKCLGDGGQGSAYLARDPRLGRLVVLKRYHARGAAVEQEGQALARVRSRYTAQCYHLERQGDELFLVMEYIPGNSLSEVRKKRALALDEAVRLVEQVADGLEAVHACGLVHRDVKPSNIVLGDDGVPRLVDFGLAAHLGSAALRGISGSPPYMAPEQARDQWERIDARTDVYGLGGVLYHLLTGQAPRDGKSPLELLEQARDAPIVPPRQKNPRVPRALERVCLKAMAAESHSRYPSAATLGRDLRRYRLMRQAAPVLCAAVVLLTLLVMAWAFWPRSVRPSLDGHAGAIALREITESQADSTPAPRPDLRVTHFEITHFPKLGDGYDRQGSGPLGSKSFEARLGDDVTVRAKLSEPAFSYLIVFCPDGTDVLCDPDNDGVPPPSKQEPMYPPPVKPTKRYRLSEGTGLCAVALVVSHKPLPSYREWRQLNSKMAWSGALPCERGVVWRDDGEGPQPLIADNPAGARGKDAEARGLEGPVVKLASWLRGLPGVDVVTLEAFSVEPASGP
jgi:serine/threonine protein kinase